MLSIESLGRARVLFMVSTLAWVNVTLCTPRTARMTFWTPTPHAVRRVITYGLARPLSPTRPLCTWPSRAAITPGARDLTGLLGNSRRSGGGMSGHTLSRWLEG